MKNQVGDILHVGCTQQQPTQQQPTQQQPTQQQPINIVEEGLIEFGSLTCPKVSLEDIRVLHFDPQIDYAEFSSLWGRFRREDATVAKYGPVAGVGTTPNIPTQQYKLLHEVFTKWITDDLNREAPYYICFCKENGDEYIIRRSLPNDKYTAGKFMILNCEYSKDPDCIPRNKLKASRESNSVDGEYILVIVHVAGDSADREKLKMILDAKRSGDNFALI
jgi:hypothetical protein